MANIKQISTGGTTYDLSAKSLYQAGGGIATLNTAHNADDYGKMYHLIATSAANDSGVKPKFSPDGATPVVGDGYVLDFHWDSSAHWNTQLALKNSANPALSIRSDSNDTWSDWFPVLTSKNVITGDNNGQIKFGGTNVSVKGLGSAAYTASTAYAAAGHNHDSVYVNVTGDTMTGNLIVSNSVIYTGGKRAWNDANKGAYIGADGTMHLTHATGSASIGFHHAASTSTTVSLNSRSDGALQVTSQTTTGAAIRNIYAGTGAPSNSSGSDGEVYIRYL